MDGKIVQSDKSAGPQVERGWDSVDEEMRKHRCWEVPEDMFRDWGPALGGGGVGGARL